MITDLAAGDYSVTVYDSGGCEVLLEMIVSEPDPMEVFWLGGELPTGPTTPDGTLEFEISGGMPPYQLTWYLDGALISNFNPEAALSGVYEVEVEDANGCIFLSGSFLLPFGSTVKETVKLDGLRIWPSPAQDHINLSWSIPLRADGEIMLYNSTGQVCLRKVVGENAIQTWLQLPGLPAGMYTLILEIQENQYLLDRIPIEH
ncbi:MAG: T9SS type A sorting domain-containing protein [Saprospirales bacterium]|nr:T9SS type A sorting domain-containing protein [Saprospirales bacterium]